MSMRIFVIAAAAAVALTAAPAFAQGGRHTTPVPGPQQQSAAQRAEALAKKKATEKAYKDALDRIPDAGEKPDPWKTMR